MTTIDDFLATLEFLYGQEKGQNGGRRSSTRDACLSRLSPQPADRLGHQRSRRAQQIEQRLRKVIARTERVSSTVDRDSMVSEPSMSISVQPADLRQAVSVSEVARALDAPEITEYWKSAPYLLNFMRDYASETGDEG